jgi:hypothetical protein
MKKILNISLACLTLSVAFTSCLKDKGFENGEYGVPVIERKAVSLPQAVNGVVNAGIFSITDPQIIAAPVFALEAINPLSSDINVQFALKPSLVAANPDFTLLPADVYQINLNGKIKAGKYVDTLKIIVPDASSLDPTKTYALGLELVSADNGCQIAANMKEIIVKVLIKNIYDADYTANGYFYHPTAPRAIEDLQKTAATVGPNAVLVDLGDLGPDYQAIFEIDPVTNQLNITAGNAGTPTLVMFSNALPASNPGYTPQWDGSAECNNTYDPVTKTFKVRYAYMGGSGYRVTEEIIKRNQ